MRAVALAEITNNTLREQNTLLAGTERDVTARQCPVPTAVSWWSVVTRLTGSVGQPSSTWRACLWTGWQLAECM